MSDIIERLRNLQRNGLLGYDHQGPMPSYREAADTITALEEERDRLREAVTAAVISEARRKELSKIMAEGGFDIAKPSVAKAVFEMWELDGKPPLPSSDQLAAARAALEDTK